MKIDMNKDFETTFRNTVTKGLTAKELLTGGAAFLAALTTVIVIWHFTGIPINVCVYFGLPVMLPIAALGFITYQGSSAWELLKEIIYMQKTSRLAYEAEEYSGRRRIFTMKRLDAPDKRKKGVKKKHVSV